MVLKLGVDVTENHQASHKCVTLRVTVVNPTADKDQDAAKAMTETWIPVPALIEQGEAAITTEINALRTSHGEQQSKLAQLGKTLNEVTVNEKTRTQQLQNLTMVLDRLESGAEESYCEFLQEDKLLSRIDAMESQLKYYMARYPSQEAEMDALRQGAFEASNAKFEHEMYSKALFKRTEEEKAELFQRLQQLKADRANTFNTVEVQLFGRQKEIDDLKQERTELLGRFQDLQNSATSLVEKIKAQQEELAASKSANEALANIAVAREASGDGLATRTQSTKTVKETDNVDAVVDVDATVPVVTSAADDRVASLEARIKELENEVRSDQLRMQMVIATAAKERAALQLTLDTTASDHTALVTRLQREVKGYKVKMAALEDDAAALESTEAMNASLNKRVAELETEVMAATASAASSSAAGGAASAASQAELTKITQEKAELESAMQRLPALELKITALETQLSEKDTTIKTLNTAAKAFATAQQVLQKKLDQADKSIANGMAAVKTGTDVTKRVKREKSELFQKMDFETKAHKTTQQKLQVLERNSAAVDQFREDAMRAKADAAAVQAELEQATSRVAEMEAQVIKATSAAANGGGSGTQQSVIGFVCGSVAAIAVQMVVAANSEE